MQHALTGRIGGASPELPGSDRIGLNPEANSCTTRLGFGLRQHRIVGVLGVVPRQTFRYQRDTEVHAINLYPADQAPVTIHVTHLHNDTFVAQ